MAQFDVLIVGGGISGLTAALKLKEKGLKVLVLEARDRVGGRTHTIKDGDRIVDLGGQWVGPSQTELLQLAEELEIKTFKTYLKGNSITDINNTLSLYKGTIPNLSLLSLLDSHLNFWALESLANQTPLEEPWKHPRATELDGQTVKNYIDKSFWTTTGKELISSAHRSILCAEPEEVSLLYFLSYIRSSGGCTPLFETEGGAQEARFVGGAQQISEKLKAKIGVDNVILNSPVQRIEQKLDSALVHSKSGLYIAKKVIIAIPPALQNHIEFVPNLPTSRVQLNRRMPMGSVIKTIVYYSTPWWREKDYSGLMISNGGPVTTSFDLCNSDNTQFALMGFVVGKYATFYSDKSEEELKNAVLDHYARAFKASEAKCPIAFYAKNWIKEEFSAGCYVGLMGTGTLTRFGEAIRTPTGLIHFAGTETASVWMGYIEGAIRAGKRAAEEILVALQCH